MHVMVRVHDEDFDFSKVKKWYNGSSSCVGPSELVPVVTL